LEKNKTDPKENPIRNPILAAIVSLIVAGLGQIYGGQVLKGVVVFTRGAARQRHADDDPDRLDPVAHSRPLDTGRRVQNRPSLGSITR
jgi:hypothetical protein